MTDVQDRYRQISRGFNSAVRAAGTDKWEAQSPCEQWKAHDVVAHVVQGHRGLISGVRGGESKPLGADERLDEDSVRHAYEALKPMDAMIRQPNVFGPKLEPPAGADLQTEFLYFLGRRA